jgi:hypothetical protein
VRAASSRVPRCLARAAGALALSALVACGPAPDEGLGLLDAGAGEPFPSFLHLNAAGRVDLSGLPAVDGVAVEPSAWRAGFSPAQVAVVRLDGVDPSALPHHANPTPGAGGVRLLDRTTGRWLPVMAELDAGAPRDRASLLIRPLVRLTPGHRVAVVVTTEAAPRPARFDQLLSRRPPASLASVRHDFVSLVDDLADRGLDPADVALAWDFLVDDPMRVTRSAIATLDGWSPTIRWSEVRAGPDAGPLALRTAKGSFTVPDLLGADGRLQIDADGGVFAQGSVEVDLFVHVPMSAALAAPGTVPILLFGHGIFGTPDAYLDADAQTDVSRLAESGPFIVVATRFSGLSRPDVPAALSAANNLTRLPVLTDRLVQAQVALRALADMTSDGRLSVEPPLLDDAGESYASTAAPAYYGISLGAIQGAVAMGLGLPCDAAVLHVGGSMWSTMLERSSNFEVFDGVVRNVVPDPSERAVLLAWTQLHWDLVDPMSVDLAAVQASILLQESLHDEQVPNLTTRALARGAGWPAVGPFAEPAWGLEPVAPSATPSSGLVQFDPGRPPPIDANRPAAVTGAHAAPRTWAGHRSQTRTFLAPATRGRIVHPCGEAPCSADNPGQ